MKTFLVSRQEIHEAIIEIDADNEQDAIEKVKEGEGEEIALEYNRTLDSDTWKVEEKSGT